MSIQISICLITFKHESFILQTLNGIYQQEHNLHVELIISDDSSNDSTYDLILDYVKNNVFRGEVSIFRNEINLGLYLNFKSLLDRARGTYIALCDGDDYWCHSKKLQLQFELLNSNQDLVACFHNAIVEGINGERFFFHKNLNEGRINPEQVIKSGGGLFPTSSLFFRNTQEFLRLNYNVLAGDLQLALQLINLGPFYYQNIITSVYRKHKMGVYSMTMSNRILMLENFKSDLFLFIEFQKISKPDYKEFYENSIIRTLFKITNLKGLGHLFSLDVLELVNFQLIVKVIVRSVGNRIKKSFYF